MITQALAGELRLRTIKKASQETGSSQSFFKQLLKENKLRRHYINTALFISLSEFEAITRPAPEPPQKKPSQKK